MCSALKPFSSQLTCDKLSELLLTLDRLPVCAGQHDSHFIEMITAKKEKIMSAKGETSAYLDEHPVEMNGKRYPRTIRSSKCELIGSIKYVSCRNYHSNLRSMYHRWMKHSEDSRNSLHSHTNERYMNTPQKKAKISRLRNRAHVAEQEVAKLREKIERLSIIQGENLDEDLHSDLSDIMKENDDCIKASYPEGSFGRLFWEEQLNAVSAGDPRQVRWHPVIIKWCLNLKLMSGAAYHAMRSSGFIKLPSERTLRDYTHYFTSKTGFQDEVNQPLISEVNTLSLPESRKYVGLIVDEMKIKEGLVYNKFAGEVVGFTSLGDINDDLLQLEREDEHPAIAKQVLGLMVRGIMVNFQFPYAHFATKGITADLLYPMVWEAVRRLEVSGLKVIFVTANGASPNRKFFRMHKSPHDPSTYIHKARNPYSLDTPGRWLFFFADPHLIKTVRNCWSHSGSQGTRHMQVSVTLNYYAFSNIH